MTLESGYSFLIRLGERVCDGQVDGLDSSSLWVYAQVSRVLSLLPLRASVWWFVLGANLGSPQQIPVVVCHVCHGEKSEQDIQY